MYLYLYAPFLRAKKYARELALIEGRITDFGIGGKISQLSQFLKFPAAIREFGLKRLKTLVVVGDDALLEEAVSAFACSAVAVGFVPFGESRYAQTLGISSGSKAIDIIAARRIKKCDAAMIGKEYIFGSIECEGAGIEVHTPQFSIFPKGRALVKVINMGTLEQAADGMLTIESRPVDSSFFKSQYGPASRFSVASCRIKSARPLKVRLSAGRTVKTPIQVDIIPGAIKMIVGRKIAKIKNKE